MIFMITKLRFLSLGAAVGVGGGGEAGVLYEIFG